jgi:single stranded DNA-binding protein
MNQLITLVRIGRDSEVKTFENGNAVLNFSAVHSETYLKDGEKKEKLTWYEVQKWGKPETLNKLVQWYRKGAVVLVSGTVSSRAYLDKVSNEPKSSLVLAAREINIAKFAERDGGEQGSQESNSGWKGEAGSPGVGSNFQSPDTSSEGFFTSTEQDDLPF